MSLELETVDIVIPTVGRWDFVHQALDTMETQVGVITRPIVANDSGEPTPDDIRDRAEIVETTGWTGEGAARVAGVGLVESKFVAFCDDDDRWEPNKLELQVEALNKAGNDDAWCLTGAIRVDEHNHEIDQWSLATMIRLQERGDLERRMLSHNPVPAGPSAVLVTASLLDKVGGWNPNMQYFADWDLWIRLMRAADPILIDEPLVRYRIWEGQMVSDRRRGWAALDTIREANAERRAELGVGPLDDRVIAWILQGELARADRRLPGIKAALSRSIPKKPSDLRAIARYAQEAGERLVTNRGTKP